LDGAVCISLRITKEAYPLATFWLQWLPFYGKRQQVFIPVFKNFGFSPIINREQTLNLCCANMEIF